MNDFTTEVTEAMIDPVTGEIIDQKDLAERLLAQVKAQGVSLVGPGGLLNQLTKNVLETALEDVEIRRVICTTNAIESINARYRRAVRARGHFPNEAAALKCLCLITRSLDPTGDSRARWVIRWKPALDAFAITFANRFEKTIHR